ncbi:MAG: glycoside hydrolase family 15 protein [Chloroflexi bacterium]|nr:glycoside hydrolase family 15 protein [Chloroflexota bacterium]
MQRSVQIILSNQAESGAYIASPNFPTYHYCWLRDGSFIAYSMDLVGEHQSALAFFHWIDRAIQKYAWKVDRLLEKQNKKEQLLESDFLHTRYTLSGDEAEGEWLNFQLDGYGTWLWALSEHVQRTNEISLLEDFASSIKKTVQYLLAFWDYPNYDCWEENPYHLHPYTLAAIYSGLASAQKIANISDKINFVGPSSDVLLRIRQFTIDHGVKNGHLVKSFLPLGKETQKEIPVASDGVDSSLLGVALPYRMFKPSDPLMRDTVARVESDLHRSHGGVYRYLADTYYGGGEWLLLAAWLGWFYAETGDMQRAVGLQQWIEAQADQPGHLPEQVSNHLLSPSYYEMWEKRWGPVANPLLWSHAMYLILHDVIRQNSQTNKISVSWSGR